MWGGETSHLVSLSLVCLNLNNIRDCREGRVWDGMGWDRIYTSQLVCLSQRGKARLCVGKLGRVGDGIGSDRIDY